MSSRSETPSRLFCFGLGYSARALARRCLERGWRVAGTHRGSGGGQALQGAQSLVFERGQPLADPATALAGTTHLLISIPPDADGDPVVDCHGADIAALPGLAWVGYLSTTGVYGDRDGGWVDEDSPLLPTGDRGQRRLAAERAWLDLAARHDLPVQIFRLAGIYGPGRNALETVKSGRAKRIDKPGQLFSRIHRDDIVQVLEASIAAPRPGRAYNLCDDHPAPPAEVIEHACDLLEVPPPPLVPYDQAELSPMARSFYRDNKQVSNKRIKEELGVELRYPDYKAGLKALLAAMN